MHKIKKKIKRVPISLHEILSFNFLIETLKTVLVSLEKRSKVQVSNNSFQQKIAVPLQYSKLNLPAEWEPTIGAIPAATQVINCYDVIIN